MYSQMKMKKSTEKFYLNDSFYELINISLSGIRNFRRTENLENDFDISKVKDFLEKCDAIIIGAGAGLSAAAGLNYEGERFIKYFFDFREKYGIKDMYQGGFYPFKSLEEKYAWWSRHIYFNRYVEPSNDLYKKVLEILEDKNYFVITTNVDHQFLNAGFDKDRIFETQGDYGKFEDIKNKKTFCNRKIIEEMLISQGFIKKDGKIPLPLGNNIKMKIDSEILKNKNMKNFRMNLRGDDTFLEDETWHRQNENYRNFLNRFYDKKVLYLELGIGKNTPVIIKYPFWYLTSIGENARYVSINLGKNLIPKEIKEKTQIGRMDLYEFITELKN